VTTSSMNNTEPYEIQGTMLTTIHIISIYSNNNIQCDNSKPQLVVSATQRNVLKKKTLTRHCMTHTHTHTHNHFMALFDVVWDYPGEPAPER